MRAYEFITESTNTNLIIVDVQPEYASHSDHILPGVQKMIERSNGQVAIIYNDFGGGDTAEDVYQYLAGLSIDDDGYDYDEETDDYVPRELTLLQQKLQQAQYIQKEYGFLRSYMDQGISDAVIIEIMREMALHKVSDSCELELTSLSDRTQQEINRSGIGWEDDGISLQDYVPIHRLKQLSPFYLMGGGRNECLREIELVCHAFNIKFKRVDSLVY
jgi:hypothetical protein